MFATAEFWVLVAFVGFIALVGKKAHQHLTAMLDERSQKIANQVHHAQDLLAHSQTLLADYQQKHEEAMNQSVEIITRSEREAMELEKSSERELHHQMELREEFCLARIAQAEQDTKDYLKDHLLQDALGIVEEALKGNVIEADKLTTDAFKELKKAEIKL